MKNRCKYLALFILPVLSIYQATAQTANFASNVKKSLSVDGKGLTIEYDLVFPDTTQLFDIILDIDHNGTKIEPHESDLHGDWGNRVKPGSEKAIMWDFTNAFKGNFIELKVDVIAVKTRGPSAGFDFKILTTKPPFEVKFTNKSKNAEKYSWNFGDLKSGINNLSVLESPDHEFKTGGNYNVLLTVGNRVSKNSDSIMKVIKLSSGNAQDVQKYKKQKNIWLGSAIATAAIGGVCVIEYNSVFNDWKEKGTDKLKQKFKTFKTAGVVAFIGSGVCITQVIIKSHKLKQAKIATGVSFIPVDQGGVLALALTF
jgi:hypothetical protein